MKSLNVQISNTHNVELTFIIIKNEYIMFFIIRLYSYQKIGNQFELPIFYGYYNILLKYCSHNYPMSAQSVKRRNVCALAAPFLKFQHTSARADQSLAAPVLKIPTHFSQGASIFGCSLLKIPTHFSQGGSIFGCSLLKIPTHFSQNGSIRILSVRIRFITPWLLWLVGIMQFGTPWSF